jgi:hypothetical protein
MSLEELDNLVTPPVNTVNTVVDFEAALAATATDIVETTQDNEVAVVPDVVETEIDSLSESE